MPLTEHEQRVLAEIEQDFTRSSPTFVSSLRDVSHSPHVHRVWKCGALFLAGIALLLAGVMTAQVAIGVIGFIVMLVAAMAATRSVHASVSALDRSRGLRRFAHHAVLSRRHGRSQK
jgi:hypothetical protein